MGNHRQKELVHLSGCTNLTGALKRFQENKNMLLRLQRATAHFEGKIRNFKLKGGPIRYEFTLLCREMWLLFFFFPKEVWEIPPQFQPNGEVLELQPN